MFHLQNIDKIHGIRFTLLAFDLAISHICSHPGQIALCEGKLSNSNTMYDNNF